ncbi:MAG: DUF2867 domain-containing protein [Deltaproteobacteria bacterium]|nr:DUF2867 domain-containing protein [Deltaproteobacteria bacterium]
MTKLLVTGATGYVGGRLCPILISKGYSLRCLVRDASRLSLDLVQGADIVEGDASDERSLRKALDGIDIAYYLIHSLSSKDEDFSHKDLKTAQLFGQIAAELGVKRIIYLGGLGSAKDELSKHLKSRQQTGDALRLSGVPVTEFRAGIIIGSGSLSFELLRYLSERLPVMICPRWVRTLAQPIGIRDVLRYLVESLELPESTGKIFEIGGTTKLSYGDMIKSYARQRGLKRFLIHVPVLTPRLSSLWVNFITPIPVQIARPLIEGVRNEVTVHDETVHTVFSFQPLSFEEALTRALMKVNRGEIETAWTTSAERFSKRGSLLKVDQVEGFIVEKRQIEINASAEIVFKHISEVGGKKGWPYGNFLWQLRGFIDYLLGGVGMRRGRRSPIDLRVGDVIDFWQVEKFERNRLLRLRAEMKVPGKAWLQYEILERGLENCTLSQTAYFSPKGVAGLLYWYLLYPIHAIMFQGTVQKLKQAAEKTHR